MSETPSNELKQILDEIEDSDGWTLSMLIETNAALVKAVRRATMYIEAVGIDSAGNWYHGAQKVHSEITAILNQGRAKQADLGKRGGQP